MIKITFLILCVICGFLYRYLFYITMNQEFLHTQHWTWEIPKSLYWNAYDQKICILLIWKFILVRFIFLENGKRWRGWYYIGYRNKWKRAICKWKAIKASDAKEEAGRPAKPKNEATRSWTDDEINVLIEAWAEHEYLYNTKQKTYFNRDIRQKSLTSMENSLKDNGITAIIKQIGKKLIDLKNRYRGQTRMIESSKSSGAGVDEDM